MARLHPNGSERWFAAASPLHPVMSHNKPSTTGYAESVSRYLAKVLQISPALACDEYTKLSESAKNDLHEYLMCVVGAETACHNPCHRGRRIKWHHFPLLAALCCPPLGKWIFDDSCFPWRFQDSILPVAKSDCDAELLELLIGDREGKEDGVLCMLLRDKKDSSKSNLIEPLRVQNGECRIRVAFDITRLKSNFDDGVSKTQRPAHDCSGKLYELHTFLVQHGGAVIVTAGGEVVIQKPIR